MTENILKDIVLKTKETDTVIQTRIQHPITQQKYPQRTFFVLLKKYAEDFLKTGSEPRIIGLAGLRGTGKTTLMWQLADYLYPRFRNHIYFFNVSEITTFNYSLSDVLNTFQKEVLRKNFNQLKEPIVILFDEIHDEKNWTKILKILYDEAKTAFVVCTGSSALLLQQTADLARRMKIEKVYPFRFIEYITAKSFFSFNNKQTIYPERSLSSKLKNALFYSTCSSEVYKFVGEIEPLIKKYHNKISSTIKQPCFSDLVQDYIKYRNIPAFSIYKEEPIILENIFDLFKRVIYEDLPKVEKNHEINLDEIPKLLFQLSISDEINFDTLSKKTGIKKDILEITLNIMEKAELINILSPYGGSEARIWKNKKAFFMSPSLRLSLLSIVYGRNIPEHLSSKLYEDLIIMYLKKILGSNAIFFGKETNSQVPDFIIETMDKPILIEVSKGKYKTNQLLNINSRYGILINDKFETIELENNIIKLPLKFFLLL